MIDWENHTDIKRGTWGALVAHALRKGATIIMTSEPDGTLFEALLMPDSHGGSFVMLPDKAHPDARLGIGRMMKVCRRLRIAEPTDWPMDL